MSAGAGVWIRPFRKGHRVYYRLSPGEKLHGKVLPTLDECERYAAEVRRQITTKRRTVGDALAEYEAELEARAARGEMRAKSVRVAVQRAKRLHEGAADLALGSLTEGRCKALYETLANSGAEANTHHRCLREAKTFGRWCVKQKWFKVSPWENIDALGVAAKLVDDCLTVDESRKFRELAFQLAEQGDEGATAALLPILTSINPCEIVQLKCRNVDDGGRLLRITGELKTDNRHRKIEIHDDGLNALLVGLAAGRGGDEPLFVSAKGDPEWVTPHIKRISQAAGVPVVGFRELRRTYSDLLARRGTSLDEIAFSMGHGSDGKARTAKKYYLQPGAVQAGASKRVLGILDGGKGKRPAKRTA